MKRFNKLFIVSFFCVNSIFCLAQQGDTLVVQRNEKGKIYFARFKPNASRRIQDGANFLKSILKARSDDDLILTKKTTDELGVEHNRFYQYYKGVKVEEAEFLIHGKNGNIESINGDFQDVNISSVIPSITESQALTNALNFVHAQKYKWEDLGMENFIKRNSNNPNSTYYPKGELVITKNSIKSGGLSLTWKFTISSLVPNGEQWIYVDCATGEIIRTNNLIYDLNVPCTAQTKYSGTIGIAGDSFAGGYRLRENRNGVDVQTLNCLSQPNYASALDLTNNNTSWTMGNWVNFTQDQAALDAHWGSENILDYWRVVHNRNSIDGNGINVIGYVHYFDPAAVQSAGWPNNAQWDATSHVMRYGDGDGIIFNPLTALDVCAHEMGHGITQYTANLTPGYTETGALNEGFSDIWGACVEYRTAPNKQTWLIGEDMLATTTFNCIRNLQNPQSTTAAEGQHPDTYHGQFWSSTGEPHNNSTVLSHWFYILSQGGSGWNNGQTSHAPAYNGYSWAVSGIGINNASRITYSTEANYLTSGADYSQVRNASILAAQEIFCDNSKEVKAVTDAWYAVGIGAAYGGTTANITGAEPICTSQSFTLSNQPTGVTSIAWSSTNLNGLTVNVSSGLASRVNNYNGMVNLNAIFIGQNNCTTTVTKLISIGSGLSDPLFEQKTIFCPSGSQYSILGRVSQAAGSATYNWYIGSSSGTNFVLKATTTSNSATVPGGNPDNLYHVLKVDINNQCNNSLVSTANAEGRFKASCSGGGGGSLLSVYPNPASSELIVEYISDQSLNSSDSDLIKGLTYQPAIDFNISLYDSFIQKKRSGTSTNSKMIIDIRDLPKGLYFLHINLGDEIFTRQIIIDK